MIDPVILFRDGGPFMYLIVLMAAGHGLGCLIQLFVARQVDLVPLLWAGVVSIVLTGMLGTALGQVMTYSAVANASAEMKSVLVAQGTSVSLFTTVAALMFAVMGSLMTGLAHSVVRTTQLRSGREV